MKNKKIKIIAIVLLIIAVILIILSIVFNNKSKANKKRNKDEEVQITYLNTMDDKVLSLIELTKNDYSCKSITDDIQKDKLLSKDFSANFVFSKILSDYQSNSIEKNIIDNMSKNYYGNNYKLEYNKINDLCIEYDYDENNKVYNIKNNNCTCKRSIISEIVLAIDYEKYIEIYEYRLYKENENYYSKYEAGQKIDINIIEEMNDLDYIHNLSKFKYTFKLNKNNNYYLYSVERVFN